MKLTNRWVIPICWIVAGYCSCYLKETEDNIRRFARDQGEKKK